MNRHFLRIILFSAVLLVGGLAIADAQPEAKAPGKAKAASVKAVLTSKQSISEEFSTTGNLVADDAVSIKVTTEGPVTFFPWREGDQVKKGEKLIEVDRPLYRQEMLVAQSAVAVARARLADLVAGTRPEELAQAADLVKQREDAMLFAQKDHERVKALVDSGALPAEMEEKARVANVKAQTDLSSAKERFAMLKVGPTRTAVAIQKSLVEEAVTKFELAKARYEECIICAPYDAVISRTYIRSGDLATPRAPLLDIFAPGSLVVRFAVPETYAARIKVGEKVTIKLDAYPGKDYSAEVVRVFAELDKVTRTRLVEAKIDSAERPDLLPGMFARVSARLRIEDNSIVIPDEAVMSTPRGEKIVFVVIDGKAVQRTIITGIEQQRSIQVLEGLQAGEYVVTEGSRSLKDKMAVQIMGDKPVEKAAEPAQGGTK